MHILLAVAANANSAAGLNVIAFIFMLAAAIVFLFVPEGWTTSRWGGRSATAFGLCLLTVGLIIQFGSTSHSFTF